MQIIYIELYISNIKLYNKQPFIIISSNITHLSSLKIIIFHHFNKSHQLITKHQQTFIKYTFISIITNIYYPLQYIKTMNQQSYHKIYTPLSKFISDHIISPKSTSISNAIGAIFTANHNSPFKYTHLSGVVSLEIDRLNQSTFIRVYDLDSLQIIFQCQLYYGFQQNYRKIDDLFYGFDYLEGLIGIKYAINQQAIRMNEKIRFYSPKREKLQQIIMNRYKKRVKQQQRKIPASPLLSKLYSYMMGQQFKEQQTVEQSDAVILKVVKKNSIAFNKMKGTYEFEKIQQQDKSIFNNIIKNKQQQNKVVQTNPNQQSL